MIGPAFLDRNAFDFIHDRTIREFGGRQGLRDENLLESALARPVNRLLYAATEPVDVCDLAASYAFGIASNHPFNDGNKRTG